jgi:hypothetical protein
LIEIGGVFQDGHDVLERPAGKLPVEGGEDESNGPPSRKLLQLTLDLFYFDLSQLMKRGDDAVLEVIRHPFLLFLNYS